MDCGPACIKMVAEYFNNDQSIDKIRLLCGVTAAGTSLYNLEKACKRIGIDCVSTKLTLAELFQKIELPCIVLVNKQHYVTIFPQHDKDGRIRIHDPAKQKISVMSFKDFESKWIGNNKDGKGYALIFLTK